MEQRERLTVADKNLKILIENIPTHFGTSQFHHYTFVAPMNYDSTTFYLHTQHTSMGKLK